MRVIGYMGEVGSFSDEAAHELAEKMEWKDVRYIPDISAQDVMDRLRRGEIEYGVLAAENSSVGPVDEFLAAFGNAEYEILAEEMMPIHHCLFRRHSGIAINQLTTVASHQQALMQTAATRAAHFPDMTEREIDDTALGAKWLAEGFLSDDTAVICSQRAGEIWGLDLIARNIEDSPDNRTRFLLLRLIAS